MPDAVTGSVTACDAAGATDGSCTGLVASEVAASSEAIAGDSEGSVVNEPDI